jgi:putative aldouronate transport system permease protein
MGLAESKMDSTAREPLQRPLIARILRALKRDKYLYLMSLLPLAYFVLFHYWPMYGLQLAFKEFRAGRGITGSPFVGLKHFREFFSNPYSYKLIRNTIVLRLYQLSVGFPAPVLLALLLNEIRHDGFKRIVQTSSYLPHFISTVVVCSMIVSFLATDGLINTLVRSFGGTPRPWLVFPEWFRTIIVASDVWQGAGWHSIIYLAALTSISPEMYEAAAIDGANRWQRFLNVTLPGIAPTVTIMLLLRMGSIISVEYQKILLLYSGATYETADVLGTFIYRRGIEGASFGYATAVGLFQSLVGLVFIVSANALAKRISETSLW